MTKAKKAKEVSIKTWPIPQEWENFKFLCKVVRNLDKRLTTTQKKLQTSQAKVKSLEKMSTTIKKCKVQITKFNYIHERVIRIAAANEIKMQEIVKDYESLFKKWGTTITFYERRKKGGDWLPGDVVEEEEYQVKRSNTHSRGRPKRRKGDSYLT